MSRPFALLLFWEKAEDNLADKDMPICFGPYAEKEANEAVAFVIEYQQASVARGDTSATARKLVPMVRQLGHALKPFLSF